MSNSLCLRELSTTNRTVRVCVCVPVLCARVYVCGGKVGININESSRTRERRGKKWHERDERRTTNVGRAVGRTVGGVGSRRLLFLAFLVGHRV